MMSTYLNASDSRKPVCQSPFLLVLKFAVDKVSSNAVIEEDSVSHKRCNNIVNFTKVASNDTVIGDRQLRMRVRNQ